MKIFRRFLCCSVLFLTASVGNLFAVLPNTGNPNGQSQNVYVEPNNTAPSYGNNGYAGYNFLTSPPPPSTNSAFPDDAEQNALYQELQDR
jgi:hypothetical protein